MKLGDEGRFKKVGKIVLGAMTSSCDHCGSVKNLGYGCDLSALLICGVHGGIVGGKQGSLKSSFFSRIYSY